jgi:hypothetical protein
VGNVIFVQTSPEKVARKSLGHIEQRYDPFFGSRFETAPFVDVLFRPEEIHRASGIGDVFEPLPERETGVGDHASGFAVMHNAVLHFHTDR